MFIPFFCARGDVHKTGEVQVGYKEEVLYCEGGEELAQVAQRYCGCPVPGSVQGQVGWGLEQPGLLEGVPAYGRVWNQMILRSFPTLAIL